LWIESRKILRNQDLRIDDPPLHPQNIDYVDLKRKIINSKHLAAGGETFEFRESTSSTNRTFGSNPQNIAE